MRLVGGPGGNPADEQVFLIRRKQMIALWRRHDQVGVSLPDPGNQFAFVGSARHDGSQATLKFDNCPIPPIKPQAGLPVMFVRTVTGNTVMRQDWPDVVVKRN